MLMAPAVYAIPMMQGTLDRMVSMRLQVRLRLRAKSLLFDNEMRAHHNKSTSGWSL